MQSLSLFFRYINSINEENLESEQSQKITEELKNIYEKKFKIGSKYIGLKSSTRYESKFLYNIFLYC